MISGEREVTSVKFAKYTKENVATISNCSMEFLRNYSLAFVADLRLSLSLFQVSGI